MRANPRAPGEEGESKAGKAAAARQPGPGAVKPEEVVAEGEGKKPSER